MIKYILCLIIFLFSCKNRNTEVNLEFLNYYKPNITNGEKVFNKSCITCHLYGTGGATLLTNNEKWSLLISTKNKEKIFENIYNGYVGNFGPMPAKGGCDDCSKEDLFDAIEYILSINKLTIIN